MVLCLCKLCIRCRLLKIMIRLVFMLVNIVIYSEFMFISVSVRNIVLMFSVMLMFCIRIVWVLWFR